MNCCHVTRQSTYAKLLSAAKRQGQADHFDKQDVPDLELYVRGNFVRHLADAADFAHARAKHSLGYSEEPK